MNKFSRDATVEDLPRRGRSKPACTNENLKKMRDSVNENMKTLLKIRSQELCVKKESLRSIMAQEL